MDSPDECPGCKECLPYSSGADYSYHTQGIMWPNGKLMHEQDENCWCDPDVLEYENGEIEIIHNVETQ